MTAAGTTCSGRHCAGAGEPEARGLEPRSLLGVVVARAAPRCKSELGFPSGRVWLRAGRAQSRRGVVRLRGLQRGLGWPRVSRALSPGVGPDPPLAGPLCLRARVPAGSHLPAEPRRFSVGALPGKVASSRCRSGPCPFPWALLGRRWLPRNTAPPAPETFLPWGPVSTARVLQEPEALLCSGAASGMLGTWCTGRAPHPPCPPPPPDPGHRVPGNAQILSGTRPHISEASLCADDPLSRGRPTDGPGVANLDSGAHAHCSEPVSSQYLQDPSKVVGTKRVSAFGVPKTGLARDTYPVNLRICLLVPSPFVLPPYPPRASFLIKLSIQSALPTGFLESSVRLQLRRQVWTPERRGFEIQRCHWLAVWGA